MTKRPDGQPLLRIRVELDGQVYEENLAAQAAISSSLPDLNSALADQPGRFAWWATLEAKARARHERLQAQMESLTAQLFTRYQIELRAALPTDAKKDPTLDAIKTRITLDKDRLHLAEALAVAKHDLDLIIAGRRTMEHKQDALKALASNVRAEMEHKLYVGRMTSHLPALTSRPDDNVRKHPRQEN